MVCREEGNMLRRDYVAIILPYALLTVSKSFHHVGYYIGSPRTWVPQKYGLIKSWGLSKLLEDY